MSRRKRVLLWTGLLAVFVVAGAGVVCWAHPPRYQLIREGMTKEQVEKVVGPLSGDRETWAETTEAGVTIRPLPMFRVDGALVFLEVDELGLIEKVSVRISDRSLLGRLRRWFGL